MVAGQALCNPACYEAADTKSCFATWGTPQLTVEKAGKAVMISKKQEIAGIVVYIM
jgi:hypothetical protein